MNDLKSRLKDVMSVQTTSYNTKLMNRFIIDQAKSIPNTKVVKKDGNIYVTKGKADIFPCVVAHTDTVHEIEKEFHVLECDGVMLAVNHNYERVGVGGDDKVGVFVALESLRDFDNIKVAFFRDEEVGCHGSKVADMSFFNDVAFVLQCDRQGYEDFVSSIFMSDMYNKEFSEAMQELLYKYGRIESDGGLTDVYQLTENGLEVCVANMSCGYYDPHTDNEYIDIEEVFATLDFVKEICNDLGDTRWEIKTEDRGYYPKYNSRHRYDDGSIGYRRFGGGKEKLINGYSQHIPDEWNVEGHDGSEEQDKPGYLVSNATCSKCQGHEKVHYDEYTEMYYCFGCEDYVGSDDIEIVDTSKDDTFLAFIEDREKLTKDTYDQDKEV